MSKPTKATMSIMKEELAERRWDLFIWAVNMALREMGVLNVAIEKVEPPSNPDYWEFEMKRIPNDCMWTQDEWSLP